MAGIISLPVVEANLLRSRFRNLLYLRETFLREPDDETIHDLRVASRRAREILDYFQPVLPAKPYERAINLARRVTKGLGGAREAEVNLGILKKWDDQRKLDPVAAEVLIHDQKMEFQRRLLKGKRKIALSEFSYLEKFVSRVKGSRSLPPTGSQILQQRHSEFLSFTWDAVLDDERLHDLRIRTKKFRYAVEIHDRIYKEKLGRFIRRIRNLQDLLGVIHDLFVVGEVARVKMEEWNDPSLHIIPSALKFSYDVIQSEKHKLYPQVYPRYARILENSPLFQSQMSLAVS